MIEDATFVIDVLAGDDEALQLLEAIEGERRPEKVSATTVLELYEGVSRSSRPESEKDRVLDVLDSKHAVAADRGIMRRAGELSGNLVVGGRRIDREGEPVVTRNARHFDRIPGIEVRTY